MAKATREAYGEAIVELGRLDPKLVVLDADLSKATLTKGFASAYPDRFFNVGIAEANLMGISAGLAATGLTPFTSTFAVFAAGRAYDQVRQAIAYPQSNVKIVASHGGLTDGQDGATHQMLEDLALMRVLPGMTVVVPADATETVEIIKWAAQSKGPVYIRLAREKGPEVSPPGYRFELGKAVKLQDGVDLTIFATGFMVGLALQAAQTLCQSGISATVYNCSSLKPFDQEAVRQAAATSKLVVTVEDHSIIGGLGGAVAEVLAEAGAGVPLLRLGTKDSFGCSAPALEALAKYELDSSGIARQITTKWNELKAR